MIKSNSQSFSGRLKNMLSVDSKRIFKTPLLYILVGISFAIPILILVMTSMVGDESSDLMFTSVWQTISTVSGGENTAMGMDATAMMNVNLLYFLLAALVGLFVSEEFRCGYAKNLFTVRAKKSDYVLSKSIILSICGALMLIAYFIGAILGGLITKLSFDTGIAGVTGVIMCMLSKIFLVPLFVAIDLLISVFAKNRTWLAILGSLAAGALLFTTVPMMTPLNSNIVNLFLCLSGGIIFAIGIGVASNVVLKKTNIV